MSFREAGIRLIDCVHKTPAAQLVGYPYVAIPQMKNGRVDFSDARRISHADFVEWTKKARPQVHDVVLSRRTNPGVTATFGTDVDFALGQNLVLLRADGTVVNPEFLRWLVLCPEWWAEIEKYNNVGAVFDSLKCADVPNFRLPIPPKPVQVSISELLGSIDDKIELNRRMNETLEAMAQAIFRDWFVDFGPVRRKLEGATDPVVIMGGLMPDSVRSAELAGLFPNTIGDDRLPTGWRLDPLKAHIANFDSKRVPVSSAERAKRLGTFPYYGAASAMGTIDNFLFDGVFVLVGEDGSVVRNGGLAVTQYVWGQFWVNNHAHVLQGAGAVCTEHLLLYFNEEPVEPYVTGAVQMKLSQGRMGMMPFIFAGDTICGEFGRVLGPLFERLRSAEAENRTLAETRDYLLPRLMSGEVRVGDVAQEIAA